MHICFCFRILHFAFLYMCYALCMRACCLIVRCVCVLLDRALWFSLYVFCFLLFFCPCIQHFVFLFSTICFCFCILLFCIQHLAFLLLCCTWSVRVTFTCVVLACSWVLWVRCVFLLLFYFFLFSTICFLFLHSVFAFCIFVFCIVVFIATLFVCCECAVRCCARLYRCRHFLLCGTKRLFAAYHRIRITCTSAQNNAQNVNQTKIT